jgi:hypothetical protein
MPANFVGEIILRIILEFVFWVVLYHLGRIVVLLLTPGRVRCDRITADAPRPAIRWGGIVYRRGASVCLTAEGTAFAGLLFSGLVLGGWILIRRAMN